MKSADAESADVSYAKAKPNQNQLTTKEWDRVSAVAVCFFCCSDSSTEFCSKFVLSNLWFVFDLAIISFRIQQASLIFRDE